MSHNRELFGINLGDYCNKITGIIAEGVNKVRQFVYIILFNKASLSLVLCEDTIRSGDDSDK